MMKPMTLNIGGSLEREKEDDGKAMAGVAGALGELKGEFEGGSAPRQDSEEMEIAHIAELAGTEGEIGQFSGQTGSAMDVVGKTDGSDSRRADIHERLGIPVMDSHSIRENVAGGRRVFLDTLEATGFAMIDVVDEGGVLDSSFSEWVCEHLGKNLEFSLFIDAEGKRVYASRPEMTARLLENFLVVSGRMADEVVEEEDGEEPSAEETAEPQAVAEEGS